MPTCIIMPKMDKIATHGTIVKWLRTNGGEVRKGDVIGTVESSKASIDIEAPESGFFLQRFPVGSAVCVGQVIAYILQANESASDVELSNDEKPETFDGSVSNSVHVRKDAEKIKKRALASPLVKKLAKDLEIDLSEVIGTGISGKITKQDVTSSAERGESQKTTCEDELIPLSGWRKTMAERMSQSIRTAAEVTTIAEVDATALVNLRESLRPLEKNLQTRITYTALAVKAVAVALQEYPLVNSFLIGDNIVLKKRKNIGFAVSREEAGLVVPVVHEADKKKIVEIAKDIEDLTKKARENRLLPEDVNGGTFTVTNPGILGVIMDTPIINPPQSAILGIGAIVSRPAVVDGEVLIRSVMYLSLSYDHRVIDGAPAIRFLQRVKKILENPSQLLDNQLSDLLQTRE